MSEKKMQREKRHGGKITDRKRYNSLKARQEKKKKNTPPLNEIKTEDILVTLLSDQVYNKNKIEKKI